MVLCEKKKNVILVRYSNCVNRFPKSPELRALYSLRKKTFRSAWRHYWQCRKNYSKEEINMKNIFSDSTLRIFTIDDGSATTRFHHPRRRTRLATVNAVAAKFNHHVWSMPIGNRDVGTSIFFNNEKKLAVLRAVSVPIFEFFFFFFFIFTVWSPEFTDRDRDRDSVGNRSGTFATALTTSDRNGLRAESRSVDARPSAKPFRSNTVYVLCGRVQRYNADEKILEIVREAGVGVGRRKKYRGLKVTNDL